MEPKFTELFLAWEAARDNLRVLEAAPGYYPGETLLHARIEVASYAMALNSYLAPKETNDDER